MNRVAGLQYTVYPLNCRKMSAQVCQLTGPGVTEVQIHCTIDVTSFFTKLLSMVSSPNPSLPHRIIFV